jgi:hypothetical protein
MILKTVAFILAIGGPTAHASSLPAGIDVPVELARRDKSDEEKYEERSAAEEEEERKRKENLARVIVLKWPNTSTNFLNESVQRNVRSRTASPEAMFFPEVDLYQNGRKVPDRTVIPALQPAIVPDSNIPAVQRAAQDALSLPWNALQPVQWGLKANELKDMADMIWFVDRVELREPLFQLYAAIGWAGENQNNSVPPFYQQVGAFAVNYHWYLAAQLASQEPTLLSSLTNQDVISSISYYLDQLQRGAFPSFKVDFEQEDFFDEDYFSGSWEVLLSGIPVEIGRTGQIDVFLGRTDIYLKRKDTGHGMSERLEVLKLEEKVYFVLDVARKLMGKDFIDQLFLYKNECTPEVDGDILNFLAIYQKLHPKADVYIAVPEAGNPNKVWIWRYDKRSGQLSLVGGGPDGFPVRFVALFSSGVLYNGGTVTLPDVADSDPDPFDLINASGAYDLSTATVPFNFEFRMHYNRLMINMGHEFGANVSEEANGFAEYYHLHNRTDEKGTKVVDTDGNELLHVTKFNRYTYWGAAGVLGRDAGLGFGPRIGARLGWTNLPHAIQGTLDFGWAIQPPIGDFGGRFRPLIDMDARIGQIFPLKNSILLERSEGLGLSDVIVFGLTLGAGFTF